MNPMIDETKTFTLAMKFWPQDTFSIYLQFRHFQRAKMLKQTLQLFMRYFI